VNDKIANGQEEGRKGDDDRREYIGKKAGRSEGLLTLNSHLP
jgi:hypothetical protein